MKELAINIELLSKQYKLGQGASSTLREKLTSPFKLDQKIKEYFWALKEVSFQIEKGDVVGIIGKNGAGKSTLLKILSQITKPTEGRIEINGRVASLLEVGTGFHPELTGRENIYLNGTILGMTRKEVRTKFNEIVSFSGVEKFIDTPVKHYSSGMYVRLAFSVAAHLEPEILIIDEVLAVGDAEFQKKCLGKMNEVANQGRTVLFVSHNIGSIKNLCNKGVLLDKGRIVCTGNIDEVISAYQTSYSSRKSYKNNGKTSDVYIKEAFYKLNKTEYKVGESIDTTIKIVNNLQSNIDCRLLIRIYNSSDNVVFSSEFKIPEKDCEIVFSIPPNTLINDKYRLNSIIYQPGVSKYEDIDELCSFEIIDRIEEFAHLQGFDIGSVYIQTEWKK